VEKRKELVIELDKIDPQIEMNNLKIENYNKSISLYNSSLRNIEENKKIEIGIEKAKQRVEYLNTDLQNLNDNLYGQKSIHSDIIEKIKNNEMLICDFEEQEKHDNIHKIYKQCIHRDGIPSQLLKSYAIPKINNEAKNLLEGVEFDIWLDDSDLKLKLTYGDLKTTIDAISGSGKDRTFASVCLKFALNQINAKSKPTIFLLDEVCGKLADNSVEEFLSVLDKIKTRCTKVLVVEHNLDIQPDYVINVTKNDKDISSLIIE
jgi:DNA repair exonuclease SbcCD ATPase subunit